MNSSPAKKQIVPEELVNTQRDTLGILSRALVMSSTIVQKEDGSVTLRVIPDMVVTAQIERVVNEVTKALRDYCQNEALVVKFAEAKAKTKAAS